MASPEFQFLQDLAVVTLVAAATSLLFQRLRFPLVFGLLVAGVIIGPHTPPFLLVQNEASLQVLANLGLALLLFGLGLDFNLRSLRSIGVAATIITLAEVLFMFWLGYEAARLLGWSPLNGAFVGAMLAISSTAIIVAVLRETGRLTSESSRILFAVLVLEDLVAIIMLVLLSGYAATGGLPLREAGLVAGRMVLFLLAFLLLGILAVPRFMDWVAKTSRPEVLVVAILGVGLGGAVLSEIAGFHIGLGAFLTGALVAEARQRKLIEDAFRPVHDLFAAIFFVAVGTLVDFRLLADNWAPVLVLTVAILLGKTLSGTFATFLAGYAPTTAFNVGVSLAQIGEFSFVIATFGITTGAMDPALFPIIVGAAAITSFASPMLIRYSDPLAASFATLIPLSLRTYASVYTSYLQSWRGRDRVEAPRKLVRDRRNTIASGALLLVFWGGALALQDAGLALAQRNGLDEGLSTIGYWMLWAAVMVPSMIEFNRHLGRWIEASHRGRGGPAEGLGIRAVVRATIYFALSLLVGFPILLATRPLVGGPFGFVAWAAILALASILLYRVIRRLHHKVSDNLGRLLEEERIPAEVPAVLETLLSRNFPLQFKMDTILVPADSAWAERPLSETRLRNLTGASVVLIERADGRQLTASPDVVLLPGDRLVAVGAAAQLEAARNLLAQTTERIHGRRGLQPGQIAVAEGSTLIGKTLVEAALRQQFGVQVVAIQRGNDVVANPGAQHAIQAGDVLLVVGTQDQIVSAAAVCAPAGAMA